MFKAFYKQKIVKGLRNYYVKFIALLNFIAFYNGSEIWNIIIDLITLPI